MSFRLVLLIASVIVGLATCPAYSQISNLDLEKGMQDIGKSIDKATQELGKLAQEAGQNLAKPIDMQLSALPLDKLYLLKMTDICKTKDLDCGALPPDRVSSFVDVEIDRRKADLDERKAVLDEADQRRSFYISLGSLIVSCCAFGLSLLGVLRNRGGGKAVET
jgi:hypothetical protein